MSISNWLKKEIRLLSKVLLNDFIIRLFAGIISFISLGVFSLLFYQDKDYDVYRGLWPYFFGPVIAAWIILPYMLFTEKLNNPNYRLYYLFHPSKFILITTIILSLFLICLVIYGWFDNCALFHINGVANCLNFNLSDRWIYGK